MIRERHSGTDVAVRKMASNRSQTRTRNFWTIRKLGEIVHTLPRGSGVRSSIEGNTTDWARSRIQNLEESASLIPVYEQGQFSAAGDMDPRSSFDSLQVLGPNTLLKSGQYRPPQLGLGLRTAIEQRYEYAPHVTGTVWTEAIAPTNLSQELSSIFELAAGEDFEDGVETEFSRHIEQFVRNHYDDGIQAIWSAVADKRFFEQDIAEALLWIGLMRDVSTMKSRRGLLVYALQSESVFIRDAAVSALSYLADAKSIEDLTRRLEIEPSRGVKSNIRSVLRYLRRLK